MARRFPSLDLLQDCVQSVQGKMNQRVSPDMVTRDCCPYCHHPKCQRAGWADSKWQARMDTQEDYLLDNPNFSDLTLPSHMEVHDLDWSDIRRQAMKLEISRRRGDWTPVTDADLDGPTDGFIEVGSAASVNAVDQALAALAKKRGKPVPTPPRIVSGIEDPTVNGTLPEAPVPTPPRYQQKPQPSAEQLRKLASMAVRMGVSVEQDEAAPEPEPQETEPQPAAPQPQQPPRPAPPPSFLGNTPMPKGGIMVHDDGARPAPAAADPWAPKKKESVVAPHARIRLGGKKDE